MHGTPSVTNAHGTIWKGGIKVMIRKRNIFFVLCVFMVSLALAMPTLAQGKDKKEDKPDKIWGTIVSAQADPAGKLAPVAIETPKKEVVPLLANANTKKLQKIIGKKVQVEGKFKDVDGKKVMEPWVFVQKEKPDAPDKKL
jgi:hypothetical protein